MSSSLKDVRSYLKAQPVQFLNVNEAVCFVLSVLSQHDSYATNMHNILTERYDEIQLSETVLYAALRLLLAEQVISSYSGSLSGRGRRPIMYSLQKASNVRDLIAYWSAHFGAYHPALEDAG